MNSTLLYKISSGLFIFFGVTHTFGLFRPRTETSMIAVIESMQNVRFDIMGFNRSIWEFYIGFGLLLTVFLIFSAILSWQLGNLVKENDKIARLIGLPFAISHVIVAILCWTNFFYPPAITATAISICLVFALRK